MALKLTVESFLQVLKQSGLVEKDQLAKILQGYEKRGIDVKKTQAIADTLVAEDVVTRWQADKLLAGKHKGFFLGKYKLLDLLGKGGMSSVYLAEHVLMKRRCAIKVLPSKRVNDSSYLARFHREAQAVASVDHPNIVRAYDVDCAPDRDSEIHFLVMEYVTGQSLQEVIVRNGPAEYVDAVEYIRQSADGLEHAHRAGLVHRDIKPGNILLDASGVVKILDMGLARFFDDRDENPLTVAHDEKVLGTADYLAPEQALDSHTVDQRADIYSLGCSLYFFLTGHPPFTEGTLAQRLMWHQTKEFPPITDARLDCPPSLMAILGKMVAKNPNERFQTAADVAECCRQWLSENAGEDWKLKHVPSLRGSGSSMRLTEPRDLRSDSVAQSDVSSQIGVRGSSIVSGGASATRISAPRSPVDVQPTAPMFAPIAAPAVVLPPVAVPVAAPVVATPPLAAPVIPVAKPVIPIAQPIASVTPVAQPIAAAPQTEATVLFPPGGFNFDSAPAAPTELLFSDEPTVALTEPVVDATEVFVESPISESGDDGLFSLFGGDEPTTNEQAPETNSPTRDDEATVINTPSFAPSDDLQPSAEVPVAAELPMNSVVQPAKPSPAKSLKNVDWKQPKVMAGAVGVLVFIFAIGGWSLMGSKTRDRAGETRTTKKGSAGSSKSGSKKSEAHEIVIQVGQGGDFDSIGRALYSISEGKTEHEAAANGKPIRFVVAVAAGHPFEESIVLDDSLPGEVHLKSDSDRKVKLSPSGNDPAITIKGLGGVTIENFFIDLSTSFPSKERGIAVTGSVARCRIKNCVVSGPGKVGVDLSGAVGGPGADAVQLENVTIQNASPDAVGILLSKSSLTQNVIVQRCRFIGSMSAAMFLEGAAEKVTFRQCAVSGSVHGVRVAGASVVKSLLIENCSFHSLAKAAILFEDMPAQGSSEFCWRSNLFAGLKAPELHITKNYDAKKFDSFMNGDKPSDNNWSDRPNSNPIAGERDPINGSAQRIEKIDFASVDAKSEVFLTPKGATKYKTAGVKPK